MEKIELARVLAGKSHAPLVYFLRIGDRVKIGTSTNLAVRVNSLSVSLTDVTHVVPGGVETERALHARWEKYRVHENREWFHVRGSLAAFLRPEVLRQVKRRPASPRVPRPRPGPRPGPPVKVQPPQTPSGYTLAGAAREGIVPMTPDALRQAKRRDPDFPAGNDGRWTADELSRWYRNRPSTQAGKTG